MTIAWEQIASKTGDKPGTPVPSIPSRTSSLKYIGAILPNLKSNFTSTNISVEASSTVQTPTPSEAISPTLSTRQHHIDDASTLDQLIVDPTVKMPRSNSSRVPSYGHSNLNRRSTSCSTTIRNPMRAARVQRWEGHTRTVSDWDGLRRDPELWFDDGDCLVYLFAAQSGNGKKRSQRPPSFCVPFSALKRNKCGGMFSLCFAQVTTTPGTTSQSSRRMSSGFSTPVSGTNKVELFIPAPEGAGSKEIFRWHVTTRNFFAWLFRKPLVGDHLGQALVDLQERMHLFRAGQINNHQDFLSYAENQGYRDFVDMPDYALAFLYYAEHYKVRDIWIDAFAHCVGMNESLPLSQEFAPLSRLTKALITRAYLEMDIQLEKVTISVPSFLDADLSPAYLGLTDGARAHLDRFRSFLHSFYVEKFGYWPPPRGSSFSKALYRSLYYDFKNLYDYLVDRDSTTDLSTQKPASGGICVLQNVGSFDKRHKFSPLPHPLPLLPDDVPMRSRIESQKTLRVLALGSKHAKTDRYLSARVALTSATNSREISVTSCPIVQAYIRFERQCALNHREEKVSMADARKIRWLLIYGTLQYLISALRAPKEVRDTENPDYPLCCLVTEQSPWQIGSKVLTSPGTPSVNVPDAINQYLSESNGVVPDHLSPIQPDCQTHDYFAHTNNRASGSRPISVDVPAPLKVSKEPRLPSSRSFRRLSLSSLSSRRNSVRRLNPRAHCEIIVHGYGNGLNDTIVDPPSQPTSQFASQVQSRAQSRTQSPSRSQSLTMGRPEHVPANTQEDDESVISWLQPRLVDDTGSRRPPVLELDCSIASEPARTPTVDSCQMEEFVSPTTSAAPHKATSSSDSTASDSPFWSDGASSASSKSSTHDEPLERKASLAEGSGLLGGLVPIESTPVATPKRTPKSSQPPSPVTPIRRDEFRFSFDKQNMSFPDLLEGSPASFSADSAIGIALSAPPTVQTYTPQGARKGSMSFETLPTTDMTRPFSSSISTESIPLSKFATGVSPLRMHPPSVSKRKENSIDIFSALSMPPSHRTSVDELARTGSETKSILDAIPPPIAKASKVSSAKATKAVDEEERGRKKERRKSFWRR